MASFTWNGIAWLELEATLSEPSRTKLFDEPRWPLMLKLAPESGEPASTSWVLAVSSPKTRKFLL